MTEIIYQLLSDQLAHYRLQRHDFLNHWQVVMGYLQLKKPDQALDYLHRYMPQFQAEQAVAQIPHPVAGAILLGLIVELKKCELNVSMNLAEDLKSPDYWKSRWREEYSEPFYGYTKECLTLLDRWIATGQHQPQELGAVICADLSDTGYLHLVFRVENRGEHNLLGQKEFMLRSLSNVL